MGSSNHNRVPRHCLLLRAELSVAEKPQKWISIASSTSTIFVPYLQCTSSHKKEQRERERGEFASHQSQIGVYGLLGRRVFQEM